MAKILFVCLGNICRSPTAEAVFRQKAILANRRDIFIDSAGTGTWHIDSPPDERATRAAQARGYDLSNLRGRKASPEDFTAFTHILAMDKQNLKDLQNIAPSGHTAELKLFLDYAKDKTEEVPDPYFGGPGGFDHVLDLIEDASTGLLESVASMADKS